MRRCTALVCLFLATFFTTLGQTPVEQNGQLRVDGVQLVNECGNPVQLKGMSSHGLQWYGNCFTGNTFATLKNDWGADIVRLAMYTASGGYFNDPEYWKGQINTLVNAATAQGLYVIIDWHILSDNDPNQNITEALDFFEEMSATHAEKNNVLYEICNEPNSNGTIENSWSQVIKPYAEQVIPVIRANDPDAIVLVGTPKWSSKPGIVLTDPLTGDNAENVLYSFHFYGGSHFTQAYINSFADKVPIFATEWGTSSYTGDNGNNYENSQDWLDLFAGENQGGQLISWCNWSMSDKAESSAALTPGACFDQNWNSVTQSGQFVKDNMNTPDVFVCDNTTFPVIYKQPFDKEADPGSTVTFMVRALGNNLSYAWYKDGNIIPGATDTTLTITNVDTDDEGEYHVIVSEGVSSMGSRKVMLSLTSQQPYNDTRQIIPGRVQAEYYDEGGSGVSYIDLTGGNDGGQLRTDDVDVYANEDGTPGYGLGYLQDNEWTEYSVYAEKDGYYEISFRMTGPSGVFYLEMDGAPVTPFVNAPQDITDWTTVIADTVFIEKGNHLLRLTLENGGFDLNYINFEEKNIDCNGIEDGTAYVDSCGVCAGGTTGITPAVDTDDDGVYDCEDECPTDQDKVAPGICGCGTAEGQCEDCYGDFGGTAFIDECGECTGGNTGLAPNETCTDCAGVPGGTAGFDQCGVCSGGTTGLVPNESCRDCEGVIGGDAVLDDCGVCNGENSTCLDCEGTINGDAIVDRCGVCNGDGSSCAGDQLPYENVHEIPGTIEAEDYDFGGQDVSYNDTDAGNNGGEYRNDDVDIDFSDDGGYAIGWLNEGEWTEYTVNVLYEGNYTIRLRGGTPNAGKSVTLNIDGNELVSNVAVVNTGSYQSFDESEVNTIFLTAGTHTLQLYYESFGFNIDKITFVAEFTVDCNGVLGGSAVLDDCGVCGGDGSTCLDCAGVPDGEAYLDACGNCVAGTTGQEPSLDTDGDGTFDCEDECPFDAQKIVPGDCGCYYDESSCVVDECPNDDNKISPGVCGCGVADIDTDADGVYDCNDADDDDDGVNDQEDCAPLDDTIGAGAYWGFDGDEDGYGHPTQGVISCDPISGYAPNGGDCNDDNAAINPGAEEIANDGIDQNCDGTDLIIDSDNDGTPDNEDGCPNDGNKVQPGICGCGVEDIDADGDNICDTEDDDMDNDGYISDVDCDDNDPNRGPATVWYADTDGDGSGDPQVSMMACEKPLNYVNNDDDACPQDGNKSEEGICGCGTSDIDSDSDGTPDCLDECPQDGSKISAGTCGCGISDADNDNDGIANCEDGCPDDPLKSSLGTCGCGVEDIDTDNDGTPDCLDACPDDANKIEAGTCGCGVEENDTDLDGILDCEDQCPQDPNKASPGSCGCGVEDGTCEDCAGVPGGSAFIDDCGTCVGGTTGSITADADADGTPDCLDECPADPSKTEAGACGCGVPDVDSDADGTPDCLDQCPNDATKTQPGSCGCGEPDVDSDGDGTADCLDGCPNDGNKTSPGICGCGIQETDTDADGTPDCIDQCPLNQNKTVPGFCGCSSDDVDSDNDGVADCVDECPLNEEKAVPGSCGCDVPDTDRDGDGTLDCNDSCPEDINKTQPGQCGCGQAENECLDCNGDPFGIAFIDECDNCVGGNSGLLPCTQDCNGDWGGSASVDVCDNCTGGNTGLDPVLDPESCDPVGVTGSSSITNFSVYPNPFIDALTVEVPLDGSLMIVDAKGVVLKTLTVNGGENMLSIDLAHGLYQFIYRNDSGQSVERVVKE